MAQTIPDISVSHDSWVDVNTISGVTVGTAAQITNKGVENVWLYEGTDAPSIDSKDGELLRVDGVRSVATIAEGSLKIWARSAGRDSTLTIQTR